MLTLRNDWNFYVNALRCSVHSLGGCTFNYWEFYVISSSHQLLRRRWHTVMSRLASNEIHKFWCDRHICAMHCATVTNRPNMKNWFWLDDNHKTIKTGVSLRRKIEVVAFVAIATHCSYYRTYADGCKSMFFDGKLHVSYCTMFIWKFQCVNQISEWWWWLLVYLWFFSHSLSSTANTLRK